MNFIDLVQEIENRLGWAPPDDGKPVWKHRTIAAGVLKKKAAADPKRYSVTNLMRTVAYMQRQRISIKHPAAIIYYVERALAVSKHEEVIDLEERIHTAITSERALGDPDGWADRLTRATGVHRKSVYGEWLSTRGATPISS